MRIITTIALIILTVTSSFASNEKYEITVKLNKCKQKEIYLAHYYDGKVFSIDTAQINTKGIAIFSKDKKLLSGLYIIVLSPRSYFDILIGKDQIFDIETDCTSPIKSLKISNSEESATFVEYQQFIYKKNTEKKEIINKYKNERATAINKLKEIDKQVREYIQNLSIKYPNTALETFTRFTLEIEIPDFEEIINKNAKNRKDSINLLSYNYSKTHYWDNANLSDSTLLRTPLLKSKIDTYFKRILIQNPDTIFHETKKIIAKTKNNKEMFRYFVSYCFNYTLKSNIMGMDAAFYKIANEYYLSGKVTWLADSTLNRIQQETLKLKYNLIGNKAKDLVLKNIDGELIRLYDIDAPLTLLVFWETDCGHCKKDIPAIKTQLLDKYKERGLKICAIYIQHKTEEWKEFILEHNLYEFINCYDPHNQSKFRLYYNTSTTPMTYLLDKDKNIIAKKLDIKTLSEIINQELNK